MSENPQDPVFLEPMPVSGRSQLRPAPLPADFRHDVRFRGVHSDTLDGLILNFREPTNESMGNWTRREIEAALPAWVIEALGGHSSVDSCIRATFPSQVNA